MREINFDTNYSIEDDENEIFILKEMEKSKFFKDQENTKEEQEEMWKLLLDYNKSIDSKEQELSFNGNSKEDAEALISKDRKIPITNRTFDEVAAAYDLNPEEFTKVLEDKKVLDIGSGKSTLSEESEKKNINTDIVSIDQDTEALKLSNKSLGVKAKGEFAPFQDESFDLALMTYSLPVWANSRETAEKAMLEALRVTKKGGKIYISPITDTFSRPSIKSCPDKTSGVLLNSKSFYEGDESVRKMLLSVQKEFIETLKDLKEKGNIDIKLGRNYTKDMKYRRIEQVKDSAPTIAFIEKLK